MKFAVTGGSGFIGSNFTKKLIDKHEVTVLSEKPKTQAFRLKKIFDSIEYKKVNLQNLKEVKHNLRDFDVVAHFAARANTAPVTNRTDLDLKIGIISTYNILEAMRVNRIKKIIFASGPAVYGQTTKFPMREDSGMLLPVSLYGASKLASEGLISAYCNLFGLQGWILRFGNVVGKDMTKGVIVDFISKLKRDSSKLEILGNGLQKKDVIYVDDCIDAILFVFNKANDKINLFNVSSGTTISVNEIAKIIIRIMRLKSCKITHTAGNVGWIGDVNKIHYSISKIRKLGWKPRYNSKKAIELTVKSILELN